MSINRGKDFEQAVKDSFSRVRGVSIDRLQDNQSGYAGAATICDFIVYRKPNILYIECKSVHGNTLSINSNDPKRRYGNISNRQWEGLLEKSKIPGVIAGVICWWIDRDVTSFMPIAFLKDQRDMGRKSIQYGLAQCEVEHGSPIEIFGKKKRVFFEYDFEKFFEEIQR